MQAFEFAILDWIQNNLRCAALDWFMPFFSSLNNHGEMWIVFAVVLLLLRRQRKHGLSVSVAMILDLVSCNMILKPMFDRVRPCVINTAVDMLVAAPNDASFPSGHTAVSFAAVFALKYSGSPLWKPAAVVSVVMAFSRMYLYVHWPSDILGGILLGALVGWAGAKLVSLGEKKLRERKKSA